MVQRWLECPSPWGAVGSTFAVLTSSTKMHKISNGPWFDDTPFTFSSTTGRSHGVLAGRSQVGTSTLPLESQNLALQFLFVNSFKGP